MADINIINLKINKKPMPLDPKVEREEKGRNTDTAIKDSIQNTHACRKK
jgi:hypothetical protein